MSVWLCLPSKRANEEVEPVLKLWRDRGYKIAMQRDPDDWAHQYSNVTFKRPYAGYAEAVNYITCQVLMMEPDAQWIVCAGDDTEPDLVHSADEIAEQCCRHFSPEVLPYWKAHTLPGTTFGVMQPTGDRWGDHRNTHQYTSRAPQSSVPQMCSQCGRMKDNAIHMTGALIDRVAGSPWMGREFCLRVNQGRGPLWPEYFHMGCDEELQAVATRLGVFWQRPDLNQLHKHWGRAKPGETTGSKSNMPDFLARANSAEEWNKYKKLFAQREAAGFPGSEPL